VRKRELSDAVSVRFFMPSAELAPYFSTYYLTEVDVPPGETITDWLHPEWANLRIAANGGIESAIGPSPMRPAPRIIASGPSSYATRFSTGANRIWGIGILPLGLARFVDAPAEEFTDRSCDAASHPAFAGFVPLFGRLFAESPDPASEAARLDTELLALLKQRPPVEDANRIRAINAALLDPEIRTVTALAQKLAISPRSLERLSRRAFGFSPKLLLRRQRFMRSLAQFMLDPSLSWIRTLDWHYVDQAHFVRDFRRFMGMGPSQYAGLDHPVLRAAAQARLAAAGEAVQALHSP
jgi:AraC-like DNA-binding protein